MKLSPSQQKIVALLRSRPIRYLPKETKIVIDNTDGQKILAYHLKVLGCKWEWSWTILQETKTADYRKRISEINGMDGYTILSFHAPWTGMNTGGSVKTITRHGYILVAEPLAKG